MSSQYGANVHIRLFKRQVSHSNCQRLSRLMLDRFLNGFVFVLFIIYLEALYSYLISGLGTLSCTGFGLEHFCLLERITSTVVERRLTNFALQPLLYEMWRVTSCFPLWLSGAFWENCRWSIQIESKRADEYIFSRGNFRVFKNALFGDAVYTPHCLPSPLTRNLISSLFFSYLECIQRQKAFTTEMIPAYSTLLS